MTVNRILFSDAEMGEDVAEDFVGGNLATRNLGEDVEGLAEVFAQKVTADVLL